jgi:hypothetical protein
MGCLPPLAGNSFRLSIEACPVRHQMPPGRARCAHCAGTIGRVFQTLVHPHARAVETACQTCGAAACQLSVSWQR